MQMPGGRHDASIDSLPVGDFQRSRPSSRTSRMSRTPTKASSPRTAAAWNNNEAFQNNYSSEDNNTVDVDRRPSTSDDGENLLDHSRSRLNKFIGAVGKPFARRRSKSVDTSEGRRRAELNSPYMVHAASTDDQISHSPQTSGSTSIVALAQFADGQIPGVIGIHNHGNTCFMNAVIQCLSNTEFFAEYFVTNEFRATFHAAQKAGRACTITQYLNRLLSSLWTCDYRFEVSATFRNVVGQNAVQYHGNEQNDAQEFLHWLLDHVNEELYGTGISNSRALYSVNHKVFVASSFLYGRGTVFVVLVLSIL